MNKLLEGLANAAATRNYVAAVAGIATLLVTVGSLPAEQAHALVDNCQKFMDALGQMIGAGKAIVLIIGPLVIGACAKAAGLRATLTGRLTAITSDPNVKIEGKIVAPPEVASAVPSAQVVAKALVLFLGVTLAFSFLGASANAQTRLPTPQKSLSPLVPGQLFGSSDAQAMIDKLEALKLADFTYAAALADATGNKITAPCWHAWVDLLTKQQAQVKDSAGNPLVMPEPAVFTKIEMASELIQSLQQGGPIQVGCAPLADATRKSVTQIISLVLGGGTVSGLIPIIPIIP